MLQWSFGWHQWYDEVDIHSHGSLTKCQSQSCWLKEWLYFERIQQTPSEQEQHLLAEFKYGDVHFMYIDLYLYKHL